MTAGEYNTFAACELQEIANAAYEAGDYVNWRKYCAMERIRWLVVEGLDELASLEAGENDSHRACA